MPSDIEESPISASPLGKTIDCRSIRLRFRDGPEVLRGANLSVPAGRIVSLVGPSGCGKTTLLRCIAGLAIPSSGEIRIADQPQGKISAATPQVGYVFQEPALLPWLSALENVLLPLELLKADSRALCRQRAAEALQQVELTTSDAAKYPHQLSGGMRMRVSIARALVNRPSVLLLDEPFAALDDMLRTRLSELVLQLHRQNPYTVVLVTHNIGEAVLMSHEVAVMDQGCIGGKVVIDLPEIRSANLRRTAQFAELYGQVADRLQETER
jgi:NitT/TauT family transport system ATP-binding protein